jgi:plastocyanin
LDGIDPTTISAYAAAASAVAAAVGLFWSAGQTRAAKRTFYYQMLKDFKDQLETLETSEATTPKDQYREYHIKYLNIFDLLIYLSKKKVVEKEDLLKYFEDDFGIAKGVLEMKEYSNYKQDQWRDLSAWCDKNIKQADRPLLPNPDITIGKRTLDPKVKIARKGSFVTWISNDDEKHRIMSGRSLEDPEKGKEFNSEDSGILALTSKGKKYSHQFNEVNSYDYFCEKHSEEVGKVTITSADPGITKYRSNGKPIGP